MLGRMPHKAPLLYFDIRLKLPGLSRYSQMSTIRPVKGITAIRPANVGSLCFSTIQVQKAITQTLINSLITNRISTPLKAFLRREECIGYEHRAAVALACPPNSYFMNLIVNG